MGTPPPLLLLLLLPLLCSLQPALCAVSVSVAPVKVELYDNGPDAMGPRYTIPRRTDISLKCVVTNTETMEAPQVTWSVQNSNESLGSRAQVSSSLDDSKKTYTSELKFKAAMDSDVRNYTCEANVSRQTVSGSGGFLSQPLLNLKVEGSSKLDVSAWPEQSITIVCDVAGSPPGDVRWSKQNDPSFVSRNESLMIADLSYERDRGVVICSSSNSVGENTARLFLRVKNPQAFVAPLIILVVEIIIIAIVVAAYEFYMRRKRQQQEKEE